MEIEEVLFWVQFFMCVVVVFQQCLHHVSKGNVEARHSRELDRIFAMMAKANQGPELEINSKEEAEYWKEEFQRGEDG